jgi:hypothetical protein
MTLYTELTTGPLAAEIAPFLDIGNDTAIEQIMNRKDITIAGQLSSHDIQKYLMVVDLLLPIQDCTSLACRTTIKALSIFPTFDLADTVVLAKFISILDGLVADTLVPDFTEIHKATLLSMANKQISRSEQLGLPQITATDIWKARTHWGEGL